MAEIINDSGRNKKRVFSCKKNIRIDLTPMVDLGFLLITFFVFTSALSESKAMDILAPNDKDPETNDLVCESCALTFLLAKDNKLYYYEGSDSVADYKHLPNTALAIRQTIMLKKKQVQDKFGIDKMQLLVKPSDKSNFKTLIDIIDESTICKVKRYYIADLSEKDKLFAEK